MELSSNVIAVSLFSKTASGIMPTDLPTYMLILGTPRETQRLIQNGYSMTQDSVTAVAKWIAVLASGIICTEHRHIFIWDIMK